MVTGTWPACEANPRSSSPAAKGDRVRGRIGVRQPQSPRAYDIRGSQVSTPQSVVSLFWRLVSRHRERLTTVLDMGAGDCRFAKGGHFEYYVGVEIDRRRVDTAQPPGNGEIVHECVFRHGGRDYDACIGNPPYLRHHDIETPWKERTVARLERELGTTLNRHANLYLYFLCLALLKSNDTGLVALVIPYEWVSRPSAKALRDYIVSKRWNVSVYRFRKPVFEGVLTTASISIVDKARKDGKWLFYDVGVDSAPRKRAGVVDCRGGVLKYEKRGRIWALRGVSPGSRRVFVLTEGERIHAGLSRRDVVPCVTTLRHVPSGIGELTCASFERRFVQAGARCWLVRSYEKNRSPALNAYLESVPERNRQSWTCRNQEPWFNFRPHPVPQLLVSSGFTRFGPKVLVNSVGALAVGSVYGVHASSSLRRRELRDHILSTDFEARVVAHAGSLKKVEPRQLNAILNGYGADGRTRAA